MNIKSILSPCEFEIFERIVLGESQKEVANKTFRSFHTVQTTMRNAYAKLGINKITDAVLLYCAQTFDIADQIAAKKREIIAVFLLVLFSVDLTYFEEDFCRTWLVRRKYEDTEIIIDA